jgi:hypothetical protein
MPLKYSKVLTVDGNLDIAGGQRRPQAGRV